MVLLSVHLVCDAVGGLFSVVFVDWIYLMPRVCGVVVIRRWVAVV